MLTITQTAVKMSTTCNCCHSLTDPLLRLQINIKHWHWWQQNKLGLIRPCAYRNRSMQLSVPLLNNNNNNNNNTNRELTERFRRHKALYKLSHFMINATSFSNQMRSRGTTLQRGHHQLLPNLYIILFHHMQCTGQQFLPLKQLETILWRTILLTAWADTKNDNPWTHIQNLTFHKLCMKFICTRDPE